jgi:DNA-binding NarL/FixJ family response regulator
MSIRVLIADDQAMIRTGFRMVLSAESDMEVVGEAVDGEHAVGAVGRFRPDVVLMDIRMPRLDGIEATRRLLEGPDGGPRVLILTTFDLDEYVYESLRAGASGFLLKNAPAEQLVEAIRVVANGDALLAPSVTRRLIGEFMRQPRSANPPPQLSELTGRELEVLDLLARGHTNEEIAAQLVISHGTAKTHVAHVLQKLDLRDRVQAVIFAYENGLLRPGEEGGRRDEHSATTQ